MPTLADRHVSDTTATRLLTKRLVAAYADRYPASHVEGVVAAARERLATAPVRVFVQIFVERLAREMLDAPQETDERAPGPVEPATGSDLR